VEYGLIEAGVSLRSDEKLEAVSLMCMIVRLVVVFYGTCAKTPQNKPMKTIKTIRPIRG
jgi:hypothetical protein